MASPGVLSSKSAWKPMLGASPRMQVLPRGSHDHWASLPLICNVSPVERQFCASSSGLHVCSSSMTFSTCPCWRGPAPAHMAPCPEHLPPASSQWLALRDSLKLLQERGIGESYVCPAPYGSSPPEKTQNILEQDSSSTVSRKAKVTIPEFHNRVGADKAKSAAVYCSTLGRGVC